MCGYAGFTTFFNNANNESLIQRMTDIIEHRGPDHDEYYNDKKVALGFRRLSIMDRSSHGHQPFVSSNNETILVFNGEIYNFKAMREELENAGHSFSSHTDSEVILHGYEEYGINVLKKLQGMFAFTIWDKNKEELYIARDHFGIKPMYYYITADRDIVFASEIKSILQHPSYEKSLNKAALKPFLTCQAPALDETFFKGIFCLKPGHYIKADANRIEFKRFHHLAFEPIKMTEEEAIEKLHKTVQQSVAEHKVADVKVGAFLSGGVDSSYITALLKPDKTFSVGFDHENMMFDETTLAMELSERLGIEHHRKIITPEEFFGKLPKIQYHMDEPHANLSAVPLYFLSEMAREHVTVVLSGEGSDELFGGYDWYKKSKYLRLYEHLPMSMRKRVANFAQGKQKNRLNRFLVNACKPVEESFIGQAKIFEDEEIISILNPSYQCGPSMKDVTRPTYAKVSCESDLAKQQYLDMHQWLPKDILLKADKMSMAHSLELRVPFLDKKVFEMASQLPEDVRIKGDITKYVLRKASEKVLPKDWSDRPKIGFPVPFSDWIRDEKYYHLIKDAFMSRTATKFFNQRNIMILLNRHYGNQENNGRKIYTIYTFIVWYEQFFNDTLGA